MSAVFVKMPPPALANRAKELAPNEKPNSIVASPKIQNIAATPIRLPPTTAIPIIAPPRYPTENASFMLFLAASAHFLFATVVAVTPILPAIADKTVPNRYEIAIKKFDRGFPFHIGTGRKININIKTTAAKIERMEYSFFKNVFAPLFIKPAIFSIVGLECGCFFTHR